MKKIVYQEKFKVYLHPKRAAAREKDSYGRWKPRHETMIEMGPDTSDNNIMKLHIR